LLKELERSNEELRNRNSRLSDESVRLREDLKNAVSDLTTSQQKIHEYMTKFSEAEEKNLPLLYDVNKFKRQAELNAEQITWLEGELAGKSAHVLKLRSESSQKVSVLESKIADLESQCSTHSQALHSLQVNLLLNSFATCTCLTFKNELGQHPEQRRED
jgi:capsule polysaccharide export protein KpsE/RkpR